MKNNINTDETTLLDRMDVSVVRDEEEHRDKKSKIGEWLEMISFG